MPIKGTPKIKDARPSIDAEAESDKGLFGATINKGNVKITRGSGRQVSFALKYGEVQELIDFLGEVDQLLSDNQYDTSESTTKEDYEPGSTRYQPENPRGPRQSSNATPEQAQPAETATVDSGNVPSESGVVSSATQGSQTVTDEESPNPIDPSLASGAEAQAAFDAEPSRTPVDQDNPFSA